MRAHAGTCKAAGGTPAHDSQMGADYDWLAWSQSPNDGKPSEKGLRDVHKPA